MEVRILGPVQLSVDGLLVEIRSGAQRAILAALASRAGDVVRPDVVIEWLWGDAPPPSAKGSLQAHLSRLRRLIADHGATDVIVSRSDGYVLDAEVDAAALESAVERGRAAVRDGDPGEAAEMLAASLGRWGGTPLADVADQPPVDAERARLESLHTEAVELYLGARVEVGADVVAEAEALVEAEPLREAAWALLVRALQGAGREAEALHAYERARRTFSEELGVGPGQELRRLHAELLRADAATTDPAGPPSNLPNPLTTFVGRDEDRAVLVRQIGERRLVTIVGIGGAGKTRLATEVARAALPAFRDGAWFVDLTAVGRDEQVVGAVAEAVGVRESADVPLERRLISVLRGARALVVLDNCEHVIEAAARFTERLLSGCTSVSVLATSREPLSLPGEVLHDLAGLALPTGDRPDTEAIELLAARASDAAVHVPVEDPAAATVCRQLDGLPLAIEIVAPHLRDLSLPEVAERLEGRFRLTAVGSRVAPERHRTLEGAIAWSCDLITAEERELLGRLSIFRGSFDAETAAAVCGDGLDVPTLLPRLVARSLVVGSADDGTRYRLLETVRAYAREHLVADVIPLEGRLRTWAEALATAVEPELTGARQAATLDRLERDQDNLRVALEIAAASGEPAAVARIAVPLLLFWLIRSRMVEARGWLSRAAAGCPEPDGWRLRSLNALAIALQNVEGSGDEVDTVLAEGRELASALDDDRGAAWNACWRGLVETWRDLDEARAELRRAARLFDSVGERWGHGLCGAYLAFVERMRGARTAAEEAASTAAATFDALGERWGGALCRTNLAVLARQRGDHGTAVALLEESLETFLALDSPDGAIICLQGLGFGAALRGDLAEGRERFQHGLALARRAGSVAHVAVNLVELGWIGLHLGDRGDVLRRLEEFASEPNVRQNDRYVASALDLAGRLVAATDPETAARLHGVAAGVREHLGEDLHPELARRVDDGRQEITDAIGADAFDRAWRAGSDQAPEEALPVALSAARAAVIGAAGGPGLSRPAAGIPPRGSDARG